MFVTILIFLLILLALVLVHEWGHFFSARKLGIRVEEFGFGFPPRLAAVERKGTTYSFNWLPLGGFVKLKGESGDNRTEVDSFAAQRAWRRAIVLVAGVTMNMVLAFVLLSAGFMAGVPTTLDETELAQARDVRVQVVAITSGSPAEQAGIKSGDAIVSLDGRRLDTLSGVQDYIAAHAQAPIQVELERLGEHRTVAVQPTLLPEVPGRAVLGVNLLQTGVLSYPWYKSLWYGARATGILTKEIVLAFGGLFRGLVVERHVPADLAGPVGIAVITGQVVDLGFAYVMQFAALLSINLALINILPFPALDGGRLLFVVIEKFRRKPNDAKVEALVHNIGFAVLMLLVVAITYRDIVRLSSGFFTNLFGT
ncbi:MAG: RIP metalloprotease RseP [Candidatus Veblenbacteria bacterium]|nr:RIP metalloprotease RseP [Candidatus Veblenbacteria bacterium]